MKSPKLNFDAMSLKKQDSGSIKVKNVAKYRKASQEAKMSNLLNPETDSKARRKKMLAAVKAKNNT